MTAEGGALLRLRIGGGENRESGEAGVADGVEGGGRRVAHGGLGGVDQIAGTDRASREHGAAH